MPRWKPETFEIRNDLYFFPYGHGRLAKFRAEAIKLVLTGTDLRKVAEVFAPKYAGQCFEDFTDEQKEEKIRYVRTDIRNLIAKLTDEQKKRLLLS